MKKKIWNILGYMALSLMVLTACRNGVADVPDVPDLPMETMRLLIAAPENINNTRAPGDPGSGVDEAEDWDHMAVILAYDDAAEEVFPGGSKVKLISLTQKDFYNLPVYGSDTTIRHLEVTVPLGELYIYGIVYKKGVHGSPEQDIQNCKLNSEILQLQISNHYAAQVDADKNPIAGTQNISTFLSVGSGYYQTAESNGLPAAFSLYGSDGGLQSSYPVVRITRLATKVDVQWDAADAFEHGYSKVKITGFTYHGSAYGRLFPKVAPAATYVPDTLDRTFYNSSEISQRNGRVYHYSFSDGKMKPKITFHISAEKEGVGKEQDYSMTFDAPLLQATWYKVNVTVRGLTGSSDITLGTDHTGTWNTNP